MSRFTDIMVVSPLSNGRTWIVREPLEYEVGRVGSGNKIRVPKGFMTDFASVPRPVWWIFPPWGRYGQAAVLHDFMYWDQSRDRAVADAVFLEAMIVLGVNKWTRLAMYLGVRIGGSFAWRSNARLKKSDVPRIIPGTLASKLRFDGTVREGED